MEQHCIWLPFLDMLRILDFFSSMEQIQRYQIRLLPNPRIIIRSSIFLLLLLLLLCSWFILSFHFHSCVLQGGECPLGRACSMGRLKVTQLLLDAGSDVNLQDTVVVLLLSHYLAFLFPSCSKFISISSTAPQKYGNSPLMRAAYHGYAEVVKLLLQHGADPSLHNRVRHFYFSILCISARTDFINHFLNC